MKNQKIIKFVILLLIVLKGIVVFAKGGEGLSGGGTSCTAPQINEGQPVLLDLASSDLSDPLETGKSSNFVATDVMQLVGFDKVDIQSVPAFKYALKRIEAWEKVMPEIINLKSALLNLKVFATPYELTKVNRGVLTNTLVCRAESLKPVIFYFHGRAHFSISAWNALGLKSKAGAFVHEALRQRQLLHKSQISDSDLQMLTARIILDKPVRNNLMFATGLFSEFKSDQEILEQYRQTVCAELNQLRSTQLSQTGGPVIGAVSARGIQFCQIGYQTPVNGDDNIAISKLAEAAFMASLDGRLTLEETFSMNHLGSIVNDWLHTAAKIYFNNQTVLFEDQTNALDVAMTEEFMLGGLRLYLENRSSLSSTQIKEIEAQIENVRINYQELINQGTLVPVKQ